MGIILKRRLSETVIVFIMVDLHPKFEFSKLFLLDFGKESFACRLQASPALKINVFHNEFALRESSENFRLKPADFTDSVIRKYHYTNNRV